MRTFVENNSIAVLRVQKFLRAFSETVRMLAGARSLSAVLPGMLSTMGEGADVETIAVLEYAVGAQPAPESAAVRASWMSPRRNLSEPWPYENGIDPGDARTFLIEVAGRPWGALVVREWPDAHARTGEELGAFATIAAAVGELISRTRAREELLEENQTLDGLLAGLREAVFHIDLDGRWSFLNSAWKEMTGHDIASSLGRRFAEFVEPVDAIGALQEFGLLVSGRRSRSEREIRIMHRDGGSVWVRATAHPQKNRLGKLVGVSGTLLDLTAEHAAQKAVRESEQRFSVVFSSASDALFLLDAGSETIIECNASAARMFECVDTSELVGMRPENLRQTRWSESENRTIREALADGGPWTQELEFQTVRGRRFWGQIALVSLGQSAAGIRLLRVSDISGLKRAEEQLRSSLADKEVLLKEVYHRVKNNLQIISALLRLQARRVTDDGALEAIEKSITRVMAMSMVHEKLYQAQNLASIDFLQFAEGLVGFLNQLTEEETSDAVVHVSGTPLSLSIDQAIPLGLVLNELVTNAIKYAYADGERGVINVSVNGGNGAPAVIVVEDEGCGFPDEGMGEEPGGLGFRIVRMLVEQLHGKLDIRSQNGLRVAVTVPEHHE